MIVESYSYMKSNSLLEINALSKYYPIKKHFFSGKKEFFKAVDEVTFSLNKGETLGLVGESGCGKSTLGRSILRLHDITSGQVFFKGVDLRTLKSEELRRLRRCMQMIFQDPYASLNPRMNIFETLKEPFYVHGIGTKEEQRQKILYLLEKVGLAESCLKKYPSDFSGGQRQRIAIARALCLKPDLVIADEPVSALDVSIQSQILNLFSSFRKEFGFSCIFISHDLAVVEHISDKVAVMYLGRIVEYADKKAVFSDPKHPYTKALLAAVPKPVYQENRSKKTLIIGELQKNSGQLKGCSFYSRCPLASKVCQEEKPVLKSKGSGHIFHRVACHNIS